MIPADKDLLVIIRELVEAAPRSVADYKAGNDEAIAPFVAGVMRKVTDGGGLIDYRGTLLRVNALLRAEMG